MKYSTVLEKHIPTIHTCSFLHETYKKKFYSVFKLLTRVFPPSILQKQQKKNMNENQGKSFEKALVI